MGVSRSPQELARKLHRFPDDLRRAKRQGVDEAGRHVQRSVLRQLDRDVPGRRLRSGAKAGRSTGRALSVRTSQLTNQPDNPAVFLSARGPWQVIERDTKPHSIMPKALRRDVGRSLVGLGGARSTRSGSKKSRVLGPFEGGGFARLVNHPGTTGKRTFQRGVAGSESQVKRIYRSGVRNVLGKVFR